MSASAPKTPIHYEVTAAKDIADGFTRYPIKLDGVGARYLKITSSQNADPGVDHLMKFNDSGSVEVPVVDSTSFELNISEKAPDTMGIRYVWIKAGKNATTFTIIATA